MNCKKRMNSVVCVAFLFSTVSFYSAGVIAEPYYTDITYSEDIENFESLTFSNYLQGLLIQIDEGSVLNYVQTLVSFGPRVTGSSACNNAGSYIENAFTGMGLEVYVQSWTYGSYAGDNIVATLPGNDPDSDEIYIVCGHYDSVSGSPGADDNAGGTAAVLAAADVMSQYSFTHTVKFIAFSGEEQGLYGSTYYAQQATANGDNIQKVLNADMIGYANDDYDAAHIKFYGSNSIAMLSQDICSQYPQILGLTVLQYPAQGNSDHWPFIQQGYDAGMYHEYHFNPYYHSPQDTIDKMDMDYAMRVSRLILGTLVEYAGFIPGSGDGENYIPPVVNIFTPFNNDIVNDTVLITGVAYDFTGSIKYVMIKIGPEPWEKSTLSPPNDGIYEWDHSWDTTDFPDGDVIISAVSINSRGHQSSVINVKVTVNNTYQPDEPEELIPWLCGGGQLQWSDVKPGSEVNAIIHILNCGDEASELSWEIRSYPEWGDWTISPLSGTELKPEDGEIPIEINIVVPDEENYNFSGNLVIENTQNRTNQITIPIVLATPHRIEQARIYEFVWMKLMNLIVILSSLFNTGGYL
ncbi:MAG: M28 family metallopeptidase [Candidatus Thermoplasmatota archaeon]|nr:M28 family metallopeptidase [Candidatus Thermoplasmatota archaeon]